MADPVESASPPRRKLEVLRRIVLATLVSAACVVAFVPRHVAVSMTLMSFDEEFRRQQPSVSRAVFVQQQVSKVDTHPVEEDSQDWLRLGNEARSRGYYADPSDPAFSGLSLDSGPRVVILKDGRPISYFLVAKVEGANLSAMPWAFSHPFSRHSFGLAALGLIAYLAIRWKAGDSDARYRQYVPVACDLMGLLLLVPGVCFVRGSSGPEAVTGALMALAGLGFLAGGCWYASLRLQCLPGGLRAVHLFEVVSIPFESIQSASVDAEAPMWTSSGRQSPRFNVVRIDGNRVGMWVRSAYGIAEKVIPHLEKAGVRVAVHTDF